MGNKTRTTVGVVRSEDRGGGPTLLVMSLDLFASLPLPPEGEILIGRSTKCDVQLEDPLVSRQHARLYLGKPHTIEDLQSVNGTRVREELIPPGARVPVAPGEAIGVGSSVLVVQQAAAVAGARRIWSHRYFGARLSEQCARAQGSGGRFVLVRVRLEEPISWTRVVPLLARELPEPHLFAAYGPHDFELMLVETTGQEVPRLLAAVEKTLRGADASARFGTAWYPRDGRSAESLLERANALLRSPEAKPVAKPLESAAPAMKRALELAARAAPSNISVLLTGETGVGKEVMAQSIHRASPRAAKPIIALNCAGLSESLIEAELFGHERGSFTGASQAKIGLLEAADGGTVFLDEIGEMPQQIQAKVLRVIETREIMPVGGRAARPIDVRFIAATNRNLEAEAEGGEFRRDLYFRLAGITILIPPLRERSSEIEPLARQFLEEAARASQRYPAPTLGADAVASLERYHWPGNVRELKNVIERALLLCDFTTIGVEHLEEKVVRSAPAASTENRREQQTRSMPSLSADEDLERQRIVAALDACAGNQSRASEMLNIPRRTFVDKLVRYGIPRPNRGRGSAVADDHSDA